MANSFFQFKEFRIDQDRSGMKVTTDACFFGALIEPVKSGSILDIGAGTGLLSLMLAQRTKAEIQAVEINEEAFFQASQNFENSPWSENLSCQNIAVQNFRPSLLNDQIICNPPFFDASLKGISVDKNQAVHSISLTQEELIIACESFLKPDGSVWIMYPEYEMDQFINKAKAQGFFTSQQIILRNRPESQVFRKIIEFKKNDQIVFEQKEYNIRNKNDRYSSEFIDLLKPYYLHL